jgi:hypothetical protein
MHRHNAERNSARMKYEYQIRMQQRHLRAIVGALKFRQRFFSGDVYGTIGRAAMDAWSALPDFAKDPYPRRIGNRDSVQSEVLVACRAIEDMVWHGQPPKLAFCASIEGKTAAELLPHGKDKERHTRFVVKLRKGVLREIGWAVEFELRARIGHLEAVVAHLDVGESGVGYVERQCERMKAVAWQIVGGNYGPWFTYKTRFLYDIYSVIQHEEGAWRYSTVYPIVPNVPLMEISRCV